MRPDSSRAARRSAGRSADVVVLCAHENRKERNWVEVQLRALGQRVSVWSDDDLAAGTEWEPELFQKIDEARVIVILVTADLLTSTYFLKRELPRVLRRHRAGQVRLVPILLRACAWQAHPWLAQLQLRTRNGAALWQARLCDREASLAEIALEIRDFLVRRPRLKPPAGSPRSDIPATSRRPRGRGAGR